MPPPVPREFPEKPGYECTIATAKTLHALGETIRILRGIIASVHRSQVVRQLMNAELEVALPDLQQRVQLLQTIWTRASVAHHFKDADLGSMDSGRSGAESVLLLLGNPYMYDPGYWDTVRRNTGLEHELENLQNNVLELARHRADLPLDDRPFPSRLSAAPRWQPKQGRRLYELPRRGGTYTQTPGRSHT